MLSQVKTELEGRGNSWTYPDIKFTPLWIANKSNQFDPRRLIYGLAAHVCRKFVHIFVEELLWFKGRDANYPVSYGSVHSLSLLELIVVIYMDLLDHEVDQFRGGIQPLERRHRPNKVLGRCKFLVNQCVGGRNVHDQYGNGFFSDGSNLHSIFGCAMCVVKNWLPLQGAHHFKRIGEHSNDEEQGKK